MKRIGPALKALVIDEATKLKSFATSEELSNLDFVDLDYNHNETCIYGQITGDCYSERATDLLQKCAVPYSANLVKKERTSIPHFTPNNRDRMEIYSPIEYYISCEKAKNKHLIDFLQDRTKSLKL